jgi:phosphoglycerate dehydrogenase-like enzyme
MMTPFIKEHPSILTNNKGGLSGSMAEMVLSQVLRQAKRSAHWEEMKRKGVWQQGPVYGVKGKTIGVVGYGNIGEEIGRISKVGFGMKVLGLKRDWGIVGSLGKSYLSGMYNNESVESLLSQSDFVVGVLPKTPETNDYFDQRKFSMMKPGSFFMNIGRGNSVVEADLIAALETDALSGAYLDVFQQEPLPSSHKLWTTKNLFLTPHCADTQFDNKEVMYNNLMKNLELYSKGQPLINVVNKSKGY